MVALFRGTLVGASPVGSKAIKPRPVVLYGSSGTALAVRHTICTPSLSRTSSPLFEIVAYIDDFRGDQGIALDGAPVITLETWRKQFADVPCAIAIGDPRARRSLAAKVRAAGGTFTSIYDATGWISPDVVVGEGTMLSLTPTYVGPRVRIGSHGMIMQFAMISHDCVIGDYVTICPSVNVSGHVVIEDDVFIGVGASVVNGSERRPLTIGRGTMVCAGAVVMQSVPAGAKVAGNPAQDLRSIVAERFLRRTKKDSYETDA